MIEKQQWPLVAFEHFMLADDTKQYPMMVHMRFWFRGYFDRDLFAQALKETLTYNPMFQATFAGSLTNKTNAINWVRDGNFRMPFVSWEKEGAPIEAPPGGMELDLKKDLGIRLWVRESQEKTTILIQFHHALCDGVGMVYFMEDFLADYARACGAGDTPKRVIDPAMLEKRGEFGLTAAAMRKRAWRDFLRAFKFFKRFATPLAAPKDGDSAKAAHSDIFASVRRVLSPSRLNALKTYAAQHGATINDVLLRDLFLALAEWNRRQWGERRKFSLRVAMATSMRLAEDARMSAANVVSMSFLDRLPRHLKSPNELLSGIVRETSYLKKFRMGFTLIRVMKLLGKIKYGVKIFFKLPVCHSTAVLTNLGRPYQDSYLRGKDGLVAAGNVTLESLELLAPIRSLTRVTFAVNSYGGSLSLTLRYDSTVYQRRHAEEILGIYCEQLGETAALVKEALPENAAAAGYQQEAGPAMPPFSAPYFAKTQPSTPVDP